MFHSSFPPFLTIALTGTPGTGKTQVAKLLEAEGYQVLHLTEFICSCKIPVERDDERDCNIVDMDSLEESFFEYQKEKRHDFENKIQNMSLSDDEFIQHTKQPKNLPVLLVESHLAHCLCDLAVVLRSHPAVLKERLDGRGYSEKKVQENVLSEAIDIILCDCFDYCRRVYEIDNSSQKISDTVSCVKELIHALYEDEFLKFRSFVSQMNEKNKCKCKSKKQNISDSNPAQPVVSSGFAAKSRQDVKNISGQDLEDIPLAELAGTISVIEEEGVVVYEGDYDDALDETHPVLMKYIPGKNDWSGLVD
ncbi:adenylate kinase family protein [Methanolapillus ohkumae]|uniref:Putative adenylate kinase n=1 Tax=Methanolapillus ohkumae TaxID=3028298 RepID=A0AA96V6M5_9EURY|nr:hypothetical protein MsAm2_05950 [Methanosarcinaceae archaeon Am2]